MPTHHPFFFIKFDFSIKNRVKKVIPFFIISRLGRGRGRGERGERLMGDLGHPLGHP